MFENVLESVECLLSSLRLNKTAIGDYSTIHQSVSKLFQHRKIIEKHPVIYKP